MASLRPVRAQTSVGPRVATQCRRQVPLARATLNYATANARPAAMPIRSPKAAQRGVLTLRKVLIAPFAALVLALSSTLGWLSYEAGSEAVDEVAEHLLLETIGRIGQAVERHVVGSRAVLEAAFPDGMPAPQPIQADLPALRTRFWVATSLHTDPNNYVYYGNRQGQFFGLYRLSAKEAELRLKLREDEHRRISRFEGIDGREQFVSKEPLMYDPRTRPWYRAAESATSHTWTSVYIDFRTQELVATRARKVMTARDEMQGVVATDVSLRALNDFVRSLQLSPHAFAFIIEPNGELIASSAGPNITRLADGRADRLSAAESGDPLVEAAYAEVRRALAESATPRLPQTRTFVAGDGRAVYVGFDKIKDQAGLDWYAVVGVPERDFTGRVADNLVRTAWLSLLAVVLAVAIGAAFYAWMAKDLRRLTRAARRIGEGDLDAPIGIARRDEIGELARGFEAMQLRLRTDSLTGLANRDTATRRLEALIQRHRATASRRTIGIVFVDLDGFKRVNDEVGHEAGDQALVAVAELLRGCVREGDLAARYAGDEFVVLMHDLPDRATAERVRVEVEQVLAGATAVDVAGAFSVLFSASVGLAVYPGDAEDAESLIKHADREMYARKHARGSRSTLRAGQQSMHEGAGTR